MTSIGFYIVKVDKPDAPEILACRLVEKAYDNKLSLFVHTESKYQSKKIDELLWSYRQGSFVPHALDSEQDDMTPVWIGSKPPSKQFDMLVNLADEVPEFFTRFKKMAEIVAVNKKAQGRKRYAFYKDQGYVLKTYEV